MNITGLSFRQNFSRFRSSRTACGVQEPATYWTQNNHEHCHLQTQTKDISVFDCLPITTIIFDIVLGRRSCVGGNIDSVWLRLRLRLHPYAAARAMSWQMERTMFRLVSPLRYTGLHNLRGVTAKGTGPQGRTGPESMRTWLHPQVVLLDMPVGNPVFFFLYACH